MNQIKLTVGDWSGDGHEKTEDFTIHSSMTQEELSKAIKKLKLMDIGNDCSEYEDNKLSEKSQKKLEKAGIVYDNEEGLYPESWVQTILECVKHENPGSTFEIVQVPSINVGGYGLFY